MKLTLPTLLVLASACVWLIGPVASGQSNAEPAQLAARILEETGVQGGLVVHLGCGDGRLTVALRATDSYQVQGLDRDEANVRKARETIQARGPYGEISADQLRGSRLPYIDNLINLVVAEDLSGIAMEEVLRVLVPSGVAYVREGSTWKMTVKPRPDNIDEWTHYLHGPDGNAVAHDDVVGPPEHLQWLGSPRWSRHHDRMASMSALVSSGGRIFYIMDEGSRISIQTPPKWTLIARDAFNGTLLWQQPIDTWHNHLWPLKSGPTQLARRLVSIGDRVYCTLGIQAPLSALDAATGAVLHNFEDSNGAEEFVAHGDVLVAMVNKGKSELADYAPKFGVVGDQADVAQQYAWNEQPRQLMAFDIKTGKRLWQLNTKVSPLSLSADGESVYFHDAEQVVRLDRKTGQQVWRTGQAQRRSRFTFNFGTRLILHDDLVLFAGGDRMMHAYSKKDGKELWNAPHAQSGYLSPEDLLVAGGLVWNAPTTRTQDSGEFTGRDPKTGEAKVQFPPDVNTYWFHHRCYIAKATDNFIIPSRTGIEFVDIAKKQWDINHWVRGGCLYGVMPCNGMVYAPPHDCACYPETKLYGMNALAPATRTRQIAEEGERQERLVRGPAFGKIEAAQSKSAASDWPTYRADKSRSGSIEAAVSANLQPAWQTKLDGRLSSVVVADGRLYVAEVDRHTLHALDANNGQRLWSYVTGARVDSPPTVDKGRVIFGSADGHVYCLRATDGELAWRFRAAPADLRHVAFEQIESVWPVHGSVLLENGAVWFVAGRSNFLDGGLRLYGLDPDTGAVVAQAVIDDRDPETGRDIQERLQVLQMPVGLADVLSSDGNSMYMRSQEFDMQGKRVNIGPHSGQAPTHGAVQKGDTAHLFAPMGFLDDTWFHRSYWVYGRSFAGGHNGYYQAGKYTPSGRILVADKDNVYGFGRKPQYLRWTTTIEHELFSADKKAANEALEQGQPAAQRAARRGEANSHIVRFERKPSLDPTNTPLVVMAWVNAEQPSGVIVSRGGPAVGYALTIAQGKPKWFVRTSNTKLDSVTGPASIVGGWVHLAGVLTKDKKLQLYVNGRVVASGQASGLVPSDPAQPLELGGDEGGSVGDYRGPNKLLGTIDEVRIYHGELSADEFAELASPGPASKAVVPAAARLQLYCSFDEGDARDESGNKNNGRLDGNRPIAGHLGRAIRFQGGAAPGGAQGSFVKHHWKKDVPLMVRAMAKAGDVIFIAGPPDLIDEEETFQKIVNRDPYVQVQLAQQDDAFVGKLGARLQAVSAKDGSTLTEIHLSALPSWDGMAAAGGKLYIATQSGTVHCFAGR